jgi:hypothetical protein
LSKIAENCDHKIDPRHVIPYILAFFKGCPGWGANPGSFDFVDFLIPSLYRWATAAPIPYWRSRTAYQNAKAWIGLSYTVERRWVALLTGLPRTRLCVTGGPNEEEKDLRYLKSVLASPDDFSTDDLWTGDRSRADTCLSLQWRKKSFFTYMAHVIPWRFCLTQTSRQNLIRRPVRYRELRFILGHSIPKTKTFWDNMMSKLRHLCLIKVTRHVCNKAV